MKEAISLEDGPYNYFQTLSYPKKPNRPLSYLKDRFAILYWTLSNCPGAPPEEIVYYVMYW